MIVLLNDRTTRPILPAGSLLEAPPCAGADVHKEIPLTSVLAWRD